MTGATVPREEEVTEAAVAEFLAAHSDFFHRHPELAGEMSLPHPTHDKTISLVERQVSLLREQKLELKHKLQHLAQVARGNEQLLERLQRLILELIDSSDMNAALELLDSAMRRDFHADAVTVWIVGDETRDRFIHPHDPRLRCFRGLVEQGRPACGSLRPDQMGALFGDATDVTSGALIPLCEGVGNPCLGLIGVGSIDPRRFHPEMGTVFLAHLGAVAARVIRAHLPR